MYWLADKAQCAHFDAQLHCWAAQHSINRETFIECATSKRAASTAEQNGSIVLNLQVFQFLSCGYICRSSARWPWYFYCLAELWARLLSSAITIGLISWMLAFGIGAILTVIYIATVYHIYFINAFECYSCILTPETVIPWLIRLMTNSVNVIVNVFKVPFMFYTQNAIGTKKNPSVRFLMYSWQDYDFNINFLRWSMQLLLKVICVTLLMVQLIFLLDGSC